MPIRSLFLLVGLALGPACCGELSAQLAPADVPRAQLLRDHIAALGPNVRGDEAQLVAEHAYATAESFLRTYGFTWPPLFNNFLVHVGIHKRGFCFQFAEDLLLDLDSLKVTTLELHWGEARAGRWGEHNCVVVTAKGQPFRNGILLENWRLCGHLFWSTVAVDHFPWVEDAEYAAIVRRKFAAKQSPALSRNIPRPEATADLPSPWRVSPGRSFH
jgi:hypothetical protein